MYIKKFEDRKKYLRNKRIKAAVVTGLIFGTIVGIAFGGIGVIRSQIDGLIVFFAFGGIFGTMFSLLSYAMGFYWIPNEMYIKCKVAKGIFEYERNITFKDGKVDGNSGTEINKLEDVHESAIIVDQNPGQGEEVDGYVLVERINKQGVPCIRGGDIHSNPSLYEVKIPKSETVII